MFLFSQLSDNESQRLIEISTKITEQSQNLLNAQNVEEQKRIKKDICLLVKELKELVKKDPSYSQLAESFESLSDCAEFDKKDNSQIKEDQPLINKDLNLTIVNSELIPQKAIDILKKIMLDSKVTIVTITSTNRTTEKQIDIMYGNIQKNGIESQYKLYGPEGQAILKKYEEGLKLNKNPSEIKGLMLNELLNQLPSAIQNNRLMHVGRENEYIVFDIALSEIQPINNASQFEFISKQYVGKGLYRFLGTGEGEKDALHFEIRK